MNYKLTDEQLDEILKLLQNRQLLKIKIILNKLEEINEEDKGNVLSKMQDKEFKDKIDTDQSSETNVLS